MTQNQLDKVKNIIIRLKEVNIQKIIADYLNINNFDIITKTHHDILVQDVPHYFNRLIKQFEIEIDSAEFIFYPEECNYGNEYRTGNLSSDLENLYDQFSNRRIEHGMVPLKRLIWYQIFNGFWDKSKTKIHNINALKLDKILSEATVVNDTSLRKINEIQNQIEGFENKKNELINFHNEKKTQLEVIANNVLIAQSNIQQLNDYLNQGTSLAEKIKGILDNSNQKNIDFEQLKVERLKSADDLLKSLKEGKQKFTEIIDSSEKEIEKNQNTINSNIDHLKNLIDEVNSKKSFFDERIEYLVSLIGREVGASLFETFKVRKEELKTSVNFWKWAVVLTSLLTLIYIFFLFYLSNINTSSNPTEIWQTIAMNALKTVPVIFLLYYTISQYNKERNFQETYAFKSAVALTINAYRDQLKDETKQDDLVVEAVKSVFKTPYINHSKSDNKDVNSIMDMLKTIIDSIKDVAIKKY